MTATPSVAGDPLARAIERFVAAETGGGAHVSELRMLAGGASQEAWSVDVEVASQAGTERLQLVMRRDIRGALTFIALDRGREFAVLQAAAQAGVPVPQPWFSPTTIDGKAAFFMQRVAGEAVGRRVVADPGLAGARERLPEQLAQALATIHRVDLCATGLAAKLTAPSDGRTAIGTELARLYGELDSVHESHPALELVLRWLVVHEPPRERELVFVHGDFRIGNVLVADAGLTAILDWEFAHVSDPHDDLAWFCVRAWRFGKDELRAGGICDRERFVRAYEAASGRAIDRGRLDYLEILGNVRWAIGALMQSRRHLDGLERSIELASLGRLAAEMEIEALRLIALAEGVR
ncbi:MAG: phosphotransferase family protein [Vulcanimicrobiaceae bacterium]